MNKPKKLSAKPKESNTKLFFSFPDGPNGDWDYPEIRIELVKHESEEGAGGWRDHMGRHGDKAFYAELSTENSCCGFPVLQGMSAGPAGTKHREEIGRRFREWLEDSMVYLSAYVPETKDYCHVRNVLESAGFVRGVSLRTAHGAKYHNVRWEWNADKHQSTNLSRGKLAENLRTLNI